LEVRALFARIIRWCIVAAIATGRTVAAQSPSASPPDSTVHATVTVTSPNAPLEDTVGKPPWRRAVESIALSSFVVVRNTAHSTPGEPLSLSWVELDGTVEFVHALQAAVSFVRTDGQVTLAAGFLDLHVGGAGIAPRGRIFAERGMHLQAGRFDIPFGGDWPRFAPNARALSSGPAITDVIDDGGLNDVGLRAYSTTARWNASAWVVRGALSGHALGGRVGLTPLSNPFVFHTPASERPLEIGLSTHLDGREGRIDDQRAALDVEVRHRDFDLAAEWQERRVLRDVRDLTAGRAHGWHIAAELPGPSYKSVGSLLLGRWEALRGDALDTPGLPEMTSLRRVVAGTRVSIGTWMLLKCEVGWRLRDMATATALPARSWLLDAIVQW
jgi:hypothetical protein